jgi:hypothetical protein
MKILYYLPLLVIALCITALPVHADDLDFDPFHYLDTTVSFLYGTNSVVVGSYGGYWGLNDYFIGLLGQYFTEAQMFDLDRQIQEMSGIHAQSYNYCGESGSGYYYDSNSSTWTYGGGRCGKHYSEIANLAFVIDIETGTVKTTIASATLTGVYDSSFETTLTGQYVEINGECYNVLGARNWSPIMLDINVNDKPDVSRNIWTPHAPKFFGDRTAIFDLSGDGMGDYIEWLGTEDALLVWPESDGSVKSGHNLFGTAGGYKDGYEKMAILLDTDKNGWVEGKELAGLYLWRDLNGNASVDEGEMVTIESVGVDRIATAHKNFESTCFVKGKEMKTWDWWPCGYQLMKTSK